MDPGNSLLSRTARNLFERCLDLLGSVSRQAITYHARPGTAAGFGLWSDATPAAGEVAIVLQGPVSAFTVESIKMYASACAGCPLIVSTWADVGQEFVQALECHATVIRSEKPSDPGQSHFNYQIVSSLAGVNHARAIGSRYVLKTRTDQRFYAPNVPAFLVSVLDAFPLSGTPAARGRIVGTSFNTFRFRLYGLSDMLLFGHTDDMMRLWSLPHSQHRTTRRGQGGTWREAASERLCEVYLETEYLAAIGWDPAWTLRDSWRAYAELFCVVDAESLDLYWPKYQPTREYRRRSYHARRTDEFLRFSDWLRLYTGEWRDADRWERILDQQPGAVARLPPEARSDGRAPSSP
jgi:hypothetical protein